MNWIRTRPQICLCLFALAALVPFIAKPFNIDDPLFIWSAQHIQHHPADPYGFDVLWYTQKMPMWEVTQNPPLACYYLALAGAVLGPGEIALHAAFLLPAIFALLGTYRLARYFCPTPIFAGISMLFTPVFLISSTSVMCDVLTLAFWVWSILLWVEGIKLGKPGRLFGSALLVLMAFCTKYFGICLVPLLAAYTLIKTRKVGLWSCALLLPVAGVIVYEWATFHLYGKPLFSSAGNYAGQWNPLDVGQMPGKMLIALNFTGGCMAFATLLTLWVWKRKEVAVMIITAAVFAFCVLSTSFWTKYPELKGRVGKIELQILFWSIGGASVLVAAFMEAFQARDAESWLLALWIWGTFIFTAFLNWTVNGRSILPMAPAVAILIARRLGQTNVFDGEKKKRIVWFVSAVAAFLGLMIARADFHFAEAQKTAAREICEKYGSERLRFFGHWGWQYYMEQNGARPMIGGVPTGNLIIAVAANNDNGGFSNKGLTTEDTITKYQRPWVSTMNGNLGAGFYSSMFEPLPFAFGNYPLETFVIFKLGAK